MLVLVLVVVLVLVPVVVEVTVVVVVVVVVVVLVLVLVLVLLVVVLVLGHDELRDEDCPNCNEGPSAQTTPQTMPKLQGGPFCTMTFVTRIAQTAARALLHKRHPRPCPNCREGPSAT